MRTPRNLRRALRIGGLMLLLPPAGGLASSAPKPAPEGETRAVDVVLCLDVSGSMEDLRDSTRAR